MRTKIIRLLLVLLPLLTGMRVRAQEGSVEMADLMRSEGKIYVVILVILTILFGLIFYVWRLDKKISKLENDNS